jgi:hypothetical protein
LRGSDMSTVPRDAQSVDSFRSSSLQVEVTRRGSGDWFIREGGHAYPVTADHVAKRFGVPFTETVAKFTAQWVLFEGIEQPAEPQPTRPIRCWTTDCHLKASLIIDGQRVNVRWCRFGPADMPLYKRIVDTSDAAWRSGPNGEPPARKAFIHLSDADVETLRRIAAMDKPTPTLPTSPTPQRITQQVRQPNPAAWNGLTA